MYIHSVSLKNYKSIGEDKNTIILEPNITPIIGKNESGKSNVLTGISQISFLDSMQAAFNKDITNRNNGSDADIEYNIVLKPTLEEKNKWGNKRETSITIKKDSYTARGGFVDYYNEQINKNLSQLLPLISQNPFQFRDSDLKSYENRLSSLQKKDLLNFEQINSSLMFLKNQLQRIDAEKRENISSILSATISDWENISQSLPVVFYRNTNKILRTQYKLDEVKTELANPKSAPNSLLSDFVRLIEISNTDFITAVTAGSSAEKISIRNKINRKVNSLINEKFQAFYTVEEVSLAVAIDSNILSFSVQTADGEALTLAERSNGLIWYLNTFIDAIAHGMSKTNVVYLFDEPGTSLHINAQKELLNLFHDLSDKGNQIVYTTHLPSMIDMENDGIHRIRAVTKDTKGYTYIYKTAYDANLSPNENKKETLAPIVAAIGMNLNDSFGPSQEKMNIVVEGVSDYIYIHTIAKCLQYDLNKYAFIASIGVSNCINICTILHGWGCPFFAVFDYDNEGVNGGGEILRKKFLCNLDEHYCYISPIKQEDVDNHTYKTSPCMIESLVTEDELNNFKRTHDIASNVDKTLTAKLFCNAVEDGSHELGNQCLENFDKLLKRITKS